MTSYRPKVYRDPIHGQIRYKRVDLASQIPANNKLDEQLSWVVRRLIDCPEFQRLRHIRQNGLCNLVFHGAEHSRFSHSMGVCYLAQEMYDRVVRNMGEEVEPERKLATTVAALLHDIGHGPFSHTMEEILKKAKIDFDHEDMTIRIIEEGATHINKVLLEVDKEFSEKIVPYIDKKRRETSTHWTHQIVSSQLDADRLDYLMRDAQFAGIQGHGFDIPRLLDMLRHHKGESIAVDRHAIEAVEAYLLMLEQMYRAVYFHPTIRAATMLLSSVLRRAIDLYLQGDTKIFPDSISGNHHPLRSLIDCGGTKVPIEQYVRLGEHHVWTLIEDWQNTQDPILSDLATRLMQRKLFKAVNISKMNHTQFNELMRVTKKLVISNLGSLNLNLENTEKYYVLSDEPPSRKSYKRYDFRPEERAIGSIWMVSDDNELTPCPIEDEESTTMIVSALKQKSTSFSVCSLIFPHEVISQVRQAIREFS